MSLSCLHRIEVPPAPTILCIYYFFFIMSDYEFHNTASDYFFILGIIPQPDLIIHGPSYKIMSHWNVYRDNISDNCLICK